MFYVVCTYICIAVVAFIFIPAHMPETNLERLQRQRLEKKQNEIKETEEIEKWANEA